jgi:hypothetical protein
MLAAVPVVHTTGINLDSLGSFILASLVAVGGATGFIVRRIDRSKDRTQISLDEINQHLADQQAEQQRANLDFTTRLARVEGQLTAPARAPRWLRR